MASLLGNQIGILATVFSWRHTVLWMLQLHCHVWPPSFSFEVLTFCQISTAFMAARLFTFHLLTDLPLNSPLTCFSKVQAQWTIYLFAVSAKQSWLWHVEGSHILKLCNQFCKHNAGGQLPMNLLLGAISMQREMQEISWGVTRLKFVASHCEGNAHIFMLYKIKEQSKFVNFWMLVQTSLCAFALG